MAAYLHFLPPRQCIPWPLRPHQGYCSRQLISQQRRPVLAPCLAVDLGTHIGPPVSHWAGPRLSSRQRGKCLPKGMGLRTVMLSRPVGPWAVAAQASPCWPGSLAIRR
jgi:hypothetical protein